MKSKSVKRKVYLVKYRTSGEVFDYKIKYVIAKTMQQAMNVITEVLETKDEVWFKSVLMEGEVDYEVK